MGKIEDLAANYERHLSVPWQRSVSGAQRVMLLIYDKELERTLRARLGEFEIKTKGAGYDWLQHDCTATFSKWLSNDEYREAFFESPESLAMKIEGEFKDHIVDGLREDLRSANDKTVVALTGVASLYPFAHISEIISAVEPDIKGRLILFFPGAKDGNNYRLLDARDGWNYLAIGITAQNIGGIA
jgi:hypothetical protein